MSPETRVLKVINAGKKASVIALKPLLVLLQKPRLYVVN
jgi:hypothetical protein